MASQSMRCCRRVVIATWMLTARRLEADQTKSVGEEQNKIENHSDNSECAPDDVQYETYPSILGKIICK